MKYLCLMNVNKMNKLTKLELNLKNNMIENIELEEWLEWIEKDKLVDLRLDLKGNGLEYNDNIKLDEVKNCEVYVDIWNENEE